MNVSPHKDEQGHGPEHHDDVVAPEAAEIQQGRGKSQHNCGNERAAASDVVAQEVGQSSQSGAEKRVAQAGGEVAVAQDGEYGRHHFYLERAVHPG